MHRPLLLMEPPDGNAPAGANRAGIEQQNNGGCRFPFRIAYAIRTARESGRKRRSDIGRKLIDGVNAHVKR